MEYAEVLAVSSEWIAENVWGIAVALAVAVAGWTLSGFLSRHSREFLPRTRHIDATLAPLLAHVIRYGILIVTAIIVLGQLGVQTASMLAVLGAAGLAIALALQGTLSNLACGVLLVWLRPIAVGEYIDAEGIAGSVVEVGLFGTRLRTYDGIYVHAANSRIWNAKIVNYTREATRMVETKVGIDYAADISAARAALISICSDPRVLEEPAPVVFVDSLGDSAVVMCLRCWVGGSQWWQASVDLREAAKRAFDKAGVDIPFNKLDLYVKQTGPEVPPKGPAASPQA